MFDVVCAGRRCVLVLYQAAWSAAAQRRRTRHSVLRREWSEASPMALRDSCRDDMPDPQQQVIVPELVY
jgi:hypothetical protein